MKLEVLQATDGETRLGPDDHRGLQAGGERVAECLMAEGNRHEPVSSQ